jgi:hypothetical protein
MDGLLTAIVLWLSANFALPPNFDHPKIEFLNSGEMNALRYGPLLGRQPADQIDSTRGNTVAMYHHANRTIYLPVGWKGDTPAELSVLVHELVHHLQNASGARFECPQEREQTAYQAQDRWLRLFDSDLAREFQIDPFTLKVLTACGF